MQHIPLSMIGHHDINDVALILRVIFNFRYLLLCTVDHTLSILWNICLYRKNIYYRKDKFFTNLYVRVCQTKIKLFRLFYIMYVTKISWNCNFRYSYNILGLISYEFGNITSTMEFILSCIFLFYVWIFIFLVPICDIKLTVPSLAVSWFNWMRT